MSKSKIKIEYVSEDKIKPYKNNSKLHPPEQIELIKNSMKEFGVVNPMGIDKDGSLVFGHGRFESMKQLGYKEFPVYYIDHLSESQVKMLRLADNRTNESLWDDELLDFELIDLSEEFNIQDFGFGFEDEDFSDKNIEIDTDEYEDEMELKFKLTYSEYELANEKLKEIASTPENALKILLKMEL